MKNPLFYAKVLLFGEYGVLQNSKGLSLPLDDFKGSLKFSIAKSEAVIESNRLLRAYADNLAVLNQSADLDLRFDMKQLQRDIANGLYFDSNIPQRYGIGSSGALVAALYERYAIRKIDVDRDLDKGKIERLKNIFAEMENYFHGTSSGLDPLVCYLKLPLLIHSKTGVDTVDVPICKSGKGSVFLLNSGTPGQTEPMINIFFEKLKSQGFRQTMKAEFTRYNNACIDAFMKRELGGVFDNLKALSAWAYAHLRPMIPHSLLEIWAQGIQSNDYYLKLCGSGGGGYILGFTLDYEKTRHLLRDYNIDLIYRI